MARRKPLQTNFSAGELAPDLVGRSDTEQYQNGAKSLLNRRVKIAGGTSRRPGSWLEARNAGASRIEPFVVNSTTKYILVFGDGRMDAYSIDITTGHVTAAGSVSGALWTGTIYGTMDYEQSGNTAFLTHTSMAPQVLTRTGTSTWSVANFTFFADGPRTAQPYFKVAASAATLAPSALTGSITLTIAGGGAYYIAGHVGTIVRYLGRECLITAVAGDGLSCTATATETLPGTYSLTVTTSANFTVGEFIEGVTSGAKGVVSAIADGTHLTVYLREIATTDSTTDDKHKASKRKSMQPFANETITGPHATTAVSASAATTAAAVIDWDEQLFSSVNGYPSCIVLHRGRILFAGHPVIPNAIMGSRVDNLYSFDVDNGTDADGIFETIGDAGASTIVQLFSGEQLLALTDHGPYYVPETSSSPFRPSSIAFFGFGSPWPITQTAQAAAFDGGVMLISKSLIIKARPTGNQVGSWGADEVSLLSSHIVSNPTRLTTVANFAGGPERYAIAQNDDGTLAVLQLVEAQKVRNMVPWSTTGAYTSVAGAGAFLYAATERTVAGNLQYFLELFDQDVTLDCTTEYATKAIMDASVAAAYGGTTVNVVTSDLTYHLGEYPPTLTNLPAGPYHVGLYYDSEVETLPPAFNDDEGFHAGELTRICHAYVQVANAARFEANGHTLSAYSVTDDVSAAPPRKNGWYQFDFLGWELEPTVAIDQPDPLPLDVYAIKTVIAY